MGIKRYSQKEILETNHFLATATSLSTSNAMTMESKKGSKTSMRKFNSKRRFSLSFVWVSSLLVLLFCSKPSNAWQQPIQQRFRPQQHAKMDFARRFGKSQLHDSQPVSFPRSHTQALSTVRMKMIGKHYSKNNDRGVSKMVRGLVQNRKFGNRLLRKLLYVVTLLPAASMFPASALASTVPAPPIITCPVSAATEFRLMIRLVVAAFIGACLGKERSFAKHSAGVRTMSLVSMGAAVFTVVSCYGFANFPKVDASRMAANVASGVGFVGAGVITTSMRDQDKRNPNNPQNNVVHGLTTAATIWLSAAVGVACGVGLLRVATTAALTTILILRMGRKTKKPFLENNYDVEWQQHQQRDRSKLIDNVDRSPALENPNDDVDDHEDYGAEIHVTTHWDEHHDNEDEDEAESFEKKTSSRGSEIPQVQDSRLNSEAALPKQQEEAIEQETSFPLIANLNSTIFGDQFTDPSDLMEEIVRSAWQNDNKTVNALVNLLVKQCGDSKFERNSRDDDSSSSKSDYLP